MNEVIAIKEIELKKLSDINAIVSEIQLLSHIIHKNIIKYYYVIKTETTIQIFLEYCSGGSLAKKIEVYGPLKEEDIRNYVEQILYGLNYLHSYNIIHRDIKGANILLTQDDIIKLTDFGSAKMLCTEDLYHSLKGTPNWLAPEVLKKAEYSIYSDVWSLGCTIIELACGNNF